MREHVAISLDVVFTRTRLGVGFYAQVPVGIDFQAAVLVDFQRMSRHQLADAFEHRVRTRDVTEGQIFGERSPVELWSHAGILKNRFNLRAEDKCAAVPTIVNRLDAQPVAGAKQKAAAAVPNGKGKHAPQMPHALAAVFFVEVNNRFSVAATVVAMAFGFQVGAERLVVVDFSVEDDPNVAVFVGQRLMAGLHVDDAQPPHG